MRWLTILLATLILLLQYPLWFGKGGWFKVWESDRQVTQLKDANRKLEVRNAGLDAEVRDLKQGYDAIEERARYELGLIKENEVFVLFPEPVPGGSSNGVGSGAQSGAPSVIPNAAPSLQPPSAAKPARPASSKP